MQLVGNLLKDPNGVEWLKSQGFLPPEFIHQLESNEAPIPGLAKQGDQA